LPDRGAWLRLAVLVLVIGLALTVGYAAAGDRLDAAGIAERIRGFRELPGAPLLFILLYAALVMLALPGSSLTLAGGAVFGFGVGSLLNWLGATLGAAGAYFLASALGRDAVRSFLGRRAGSLDRFVADHGFLAMLRLRLIPLVPFNALNFGAGFAGVAARDYLLATALGIIPGTLVYTYFADALLSGVEGASRAAWLRVAVAGALLVILSFVPTLVTSARRKRSS
jgi:uncharacterized membrane protein YdjX (TVP38/TMEM64 family)